MYIPWQILIVKVILKTRLKNIQGKVFNQDKEQVVIKKNIPKMKSDDFLMNSILYGATSEVCHF